MCDTLYKKTKNGMIFGKNSDRSPNEPNLTIFYPRKENQEKDLKCTYITIDQVPITNAILLVQPSWMWGGEMGINDHGVIIGNEAVFTKSKGKKEQRLLGMDLLRLGLERGNSAKNALEIIISLLEKYGQGGSCGFDKHFYYDNSFLICDQNEAYVLETNKKDWVYYKIDDNYNISNRLSLNDKYTNSSKQVRDFAKRNSDKIFTHFSGSCIRQKEASEYLKTDDFSLKSMINALRHHYEDDLNHLYQKGSVKSVCMHKSAIGDHTTSSMIVTNRTIWLTGSSTPCLSIYKPTYFSLNVPPVYNNKEESLNYWLEREYLVRAIYGGLIDEDTYKAKKDAIQEDFILKEEELFKNNPTQKDLENFSLKCHKIEQEFVNSYRKEIEEIKSKINLLPKLWQKKTIHLGKNVFVTDLKQRINYK